MRTNYHFEMLVLMTSLFIIGGCEEQIAPSIINDNIVPRIETKSVISNDVSKAIIGKEEAMRIAEPIIQRYPNRWVDISNDIVPANTKIAYNAMGHELDIEDRSYCISPDFDSWLLVIGKDKSILGVQRMVHVFVDVESGRYVTMELEGRANIDWDDSRNVYIYSEQQQDSYNGSTIQNVSSSISVSPRWAIIISGGCDMENNYSRYYNDCANVYSKLTNVLGFAKDHIFCLVSDGTDPGVDQRIDDNVYINSNPDFDNDGINEIQYRANKASISYVFNRLSQMVSPGDEVLVFMTDHGNISGEFCLWDYETLSPSQLNFELNKLGSSVKIDVVMGQCYSGAFVYPLSALNRTISTSCSATEQAITSPYQYNYFLHYWTEAISYFATTGDRYIALSELFNRAYVNVHPSFSQHPQFSSMPADFGKTHCLSGELIPYISGNNNVSTNTNSTYYIENFPSTASATWTVGHDLSMLSNTNTTAVVKGNITSSGHFCESSSYIGATIVVNGETHELRKSIDSIWKPGMCVNGGNISGGQGRYQVRHLDGEYGYEWTVDNPSWQVLAANGYAVEVLEGYTSNPVNLVVTFFDPLGELIFVQDRVR